MRFKRPPELKFEKYSADVVTIDKTGEHFRLIYDVKGRFTIHRISAEEAKVILFVCLLLTFPSCFGLSKTSLCNTKHSLVQN